MKQGIRNIAKSINLSSLKNCVRPQQVQKLVSAEVMEPCPKTGPESTSYSTVRPVTIRVCTRKDMERTCPPKLCDCPEEMHSKTGYNGRLRWRTVILKIAVVAGLVSWTTAEGVWGDCDQTEDLYYRIMATISPILPDIPDIDNVKLYNLPHLENIKYSALEAYNRVVIKVIGAIASVPLAIQSKIANVFPCDASENAEKAE